MNNTFIVSDKLNFVFKQCYSLFSFQLGNCCYLVYTYSDDGSNYYLLVSKVGTNSIGKYFLLDITFSDRDVLSMYIHNLFIDLPLKSYSGMNILSLTEEYCKSNSLKILNDIYIDSEQPFYSNSLIASTSRLDIEKAMSFYSFIYNNYYYLNFNVNNSLISDTAFNDLSTGTVDVSNYLIPIFENNKIIDTNSKNTLSNNSVDNILNHNFELNVKGIDNYNDKGNSFVIKEKNAGFTSSKYIIIGTICLLLAAITVFVSIMLIKNL